ncbi:DUF6691 family protein [Pokkaliibacter sp. CJK22405]|uniref:DUF6691 family protein n=1 Tax=Pokkaliibacter sp. CJK22405 TaxID=3384615 RepID=UPI003984AAC9
MSRGINFVSGVLFSLGLMISGMTSPQKVQAFLDIAGQWDPSLILVMVAAIAIAFPCFHWVEQRDATLYGTPAELPDKHPITRSLIFGSLLFGIGWGLAGICPGPGLALAASGLPLAWLFIIFMLIGMLVKLPGKS